MLISALCFALLLTELSQTENKMELNVYHPEVLSKAILVYYM